MDPGRLPGDAAAALRVGDLEAAPGTMARGSLEACRLADGTPVTIPFIVMAGIRPGPALLVQAAVHGREVNGVETIRRLFEEISPGDLAGTLVTVPVANPLSFNDRAYVTPWETENMNRVWPGRPDGGLSERMAHTIWAHIASRVDCLIDLHTMRGTDTICHCRVTMDDDREEELASVFGLLMVKEPLDERFRRLRFQGKLRLAAHAAGIPSLCAELGDHSRFEDAVVKRGAAGILRVMAHLGMLPDRPSHRDGMNDGLPLDNRGGVVKAVTYDADSTLNAPQGGLWVSRVQAGQWVAAGTEVGFIYSPRTLETVETLHSPAAGVVISVTENPIIHPGERTVMVGRPMGA